MPIRLCAPTGINHPHRMRRAVAVGRRRLQDAHMATRDSGRRERVIRTLTFWLRPQFVLRLVNRFQKVAGFDRSIALASSALTAVIPLAIVVSAVATKLGGKDVADRLIDRYDLTGGGAEAVSDILSPAAGGASPSLGVIGFLFLIGTVLSFTRVVQRLVEQTWELSPLSVRNSLNGLLWAVGLAVYIAVSGVIHASSERNVVEVVTALAVMPLSAVFLVWTGSVLSAKRLALREFVPFGIVAAAALAAYSIGAEVYLPHLFSTYATRYGAIGAVFALVSALFCVAVICVAAAAAGREIRDELDRIARGERPAEDEVRQQWDAVTGEARARWAAMRHEFAERRRRRGKR
jgi:uncharacterized BrkB/YihY/UPF0761 family membrane protein